MSTKLVSIVIVSYNVANRLRACLRSIMNTSGFNTYEVIVVDNASTDGSVEMVVSEFPWAFPLINDVNRGFAAASNQGISRASGTYILLLNPDTILIGDAIATLTEFMEAHPGVAAAGPQLLGHAGSKQASCHRFPSIRGVFFNLTGLSSRFPTSKLFGYQEMTYWNRADPKSVDYVCGACLIARREAIDEIGILDSQFYMYFEESDWCRRLWRAGWSVWFVPTAQVVHYGGESTTGLDHAEVMSGLWIKEYYCSEYRYFLKHRGRAVAEFNRALRFLLVGLAWAKWRTVSQIQKRELCRRKAAALQQNLAYILKAGKPSTNRVGT